MYFSEVLQCKECGARDNYNDYSYPEEDVCVYHTICNKCGHDAITGSQKTTVTPHVSQQIAQVFEPVRTF